MRTEVSGNGAMTVEQANCLVQFAAIFTKEFIEFDLSKKLKMVVHPGRDSFGIVFMAGPKYRPDDERTKITFGEMSFHRLIAKPLNGDAPTGDYGMCEIAVNDVIRGFGESLAHRNEHKGLNETEALLFRAFKGDGIPIKQGA